MITCIYVYVLARMYVLRVYVKRKREKREISYFIHYTILCSKTNDYVIKLY